VFTTEYFLIARCPLRLHERTETRALFTVVYATFMGVQKRPALRDLSNRQPVGPVTRTAKVALGKPLSSELRDKLSLGMDRPLKVDEPALVGILDTNFEDEMQNAEYAADIYRNLWKAEVPDQLLSSVAPLSPFMFSG
jgi:hypothetical protein